MIGIENEVVISPPEWPARAGVAPGDLTKYAPIGLGMPGPTSVMPWQSAGDVSNAGSFYGSHEHSGDPLRDAPLNDPSGGLIYFNGTTAPAELASVLAFLHVATASTSYAVFAAESTHVRRDRFLAQIRIVEFRAMRLFRAMPDLGDEPYGQRLTIGALVDAFVTAQQTMWGTGQSAEIGGTLGGDGDWAYEKLAFGFMIENGSNGIYRLWSRPWLVTK